MNPKQICEAVGNPHMRLDEVALVLAACSVRILRDQAREVGRQVPMAKFSTASQDLTVLIGMGDYSLALMQTFDKIAKDGPTRQITVPPANG